MGILSRRTGELAVRPLFAPYCETDWFSEEISSTGPIRRRLQRSADFAPSSDTAEIGEPNFSA